jgi:hypothetical protein
MPGRMTATVYHLWLGATNHNAEGYLLHIFPTYSGCRHIRYEKRRRGERDTKLTAIAASQQLEKIPVLCLLARNRPRGTLGDV